MFHALDKADLNLPAPSAAQRRAAPAAPAPSAQPPSASAAPRPAPRRAQRPAPIPFLIGALLLVASALKGYELITSPTAEASLWTSRWLLVTVVEAELVLGIWLISGLLSPLARWTALGVFTAFFCVSLLKAWAGETDCGCFGPVPFDPRYTAALDFGAILSLAWWRPRRLARNAAGVPLSQCAAVLLPMLCVGVPSGIIMGASRPGEVGGADEIDANQEVVLLEPEKWVGRRCPILKYTDIGDELSHGSWIVVLYHHDCTRCQDVVPEYEARASAAAADPTAPKTAFVAVPPHGDLLWQFDPGSPCRLGRLTETKTWFVTTPAVLRLQDGVVQPQEAGDQP